MTSLQQRLERCRARYPLRHFLLIASLCLALIAAIWFLAFERARFERGERIDNEIRQNANLAFAFEEHCARTLDDLDQTLRFVLDQYHEHGARLDLDRLLGATAADPEMVLGVAVTDARGRIVVSSAGWTAFDAGSREYFLEHGEQREASLYIGAPRREAATARWRFHLARRIAKPDGLFAGVVVLVVDPGFFTRFYGRADLGRAGSITLLGLDGIVRARQVGARSSFGEDMRATSLVEEQARRPVGSYRSDGPLEDVPRFVSYRTLARYPLLVAVGTSEEEVLGEANKGIYGYYGAAALVSIILGLAALILMISVTRNYRTGAALARNEARLRATFDQAAVGIVHAAPDGRLLKVNPAFCRMLGYSREELLELGVRDITYRGDPLLNEKLTVDPLARGHHPSFVPQTEKRYVRKDGGVMWGLVTVSVVYDTPAAPGHMVGIIQDITAEKEAEERVRAIFNQAAAGILLTDPAGRHVEANAKLAEMLGYSAETLEQISLPRIVHPEDMAGVQEDRRRIAAGEAATLTRVFRCLRQDGSEIWVNRALAAIHDGSGTLKYFVALFLDVTRARVAEQAILDSEGRYRSLFENMLEGYAHCRMVYDAGKAVDFVYLDVNLAFATLTGLKDVIGRRAGEVIPGLHTVNPELLETYQGVVAGGRPAHFESHVAGLGRWFSISVYSTAPEHFVAVFDNISERKRNARRHELMATFGQQALASGDLDELLQRAAVVIAEGLDAEFCRVLQVLPDGRTFTVKAGAGWAQDWQGRQLMTRASDERDECRLILETREPLIYPDLATETRFTPSTMLLEHGIVGGIEVPILGAEGVSGILGGYERGRRSSTPECVDFLRGIASIIQTAIERRRHEEKLAHLAQFDALTGLANRTLCRDRLGQSLAQAQRGNRLVSVIYLGLDHFHAVNEIYGQDFGDRLLQCAAQRLSACVRSGDTVARIGGDAFVLISAELTQDGDARHAAQQAIDALTPHFELEGGEIHISASLGIALYPGDGGDAETLLKNAEVAMYRAKDQGRDRYQFYLPEMNERAAERLRQEHLLHGALARGEFVLHYQPKVSCTNGLIVGFEALLRWRHPGHGLVAADEFIPLLEENGDIEPVGAWTLAEACKEARRWGEVGRGNPSVAVNVSARQLHGPELCEQVRVALDASGLAPALLEIELTESQVMDDPENAIAILAQLKAMGVAIAIDDFGTGYSSLAHLKRFPIDRLKVDRAFVRDIIADTNDVSITRAIITLAHNLNLKVVAEGVETEGQLGLLIANHCDEIQGDYFSRPLPAAEALAMLREGRSVETRMLAGRARGRTLLLVDDEENILSALKRVLRRNGYEILTATSGAEGLELLARHPVDVIVADQRMPGMSGVEFLRRVKTLHPETMRMVLSGYTDLQAVTDAINEGAIYKFLTKPWDDGILRANIEEAFRSRELNDDNRRLQQEVKQANDELRRVNEELKRLLASKELQVLRDEASLDIAQEVLEHLPWPVIGIDDEGMLAFVNAAAQQVCGQPQLGSAIASTLPMPLRDALAGQPPAAQVILEGVCYRLNCASMGRSSRSRGTLVALMPME